MAKTASGASAIKSCFTGIGFSKEDRAAIERTIVKDAGGKQLTKASAAAAVDELIAKQRAAYRSIVEQMNAAVAAAPELKATEDLAKRGAEAEKETGPAMSASAAVAAAEAKRAKEAPPAGAPTEGKQEGQAAPEAKPAAVSEEAAKAPEPEKPAGARRLSASAQKFLEARREAEAMQAETAGTPEQVSREVARERGAAPGKPTAATTPTTVDGAVKIVMDGPGVHGPDNVLNSLLMLLRYTRALGGKLSGEARAAINKAIVYASSKFEPILARAQEILLEELAARDLSSTKDPAVIIKAIEDGRLVGNARIDALQKLHEIAFTPVTGPKTEARAQREAERDTARNFIDSLSDDPDLETVTARNNDALDTYATPELDKDLDRAEKLQGMKYERSDFLYVMKGIIDDYTELSLNAKAGDKASAETVARIEPRIAELARGDLDVQRLMTISMLEATNKEIDAIIAGYEADLEEATTDKQRAAIQAKIDLINARGSEAKIDTVRNGLLRILETIENNLVSLNGDRAYRVSDGDIAALRRAMDAFMGKGADPAVAKAMGDVMVPAAVDTATGVEMRSVPVTTVLSDTGTPVSLRFVDGNWRIAQQADAKPAKTGSQGRTSMAEEWNDGSKAQNAEKMTIGKVKLLVQGMMKGMSVRPRAVVMKDQADLKAKFQELYDAAASAWEGQGDFGSLSAAGYSFRYDGANIVVNGETLLETGQRVVVLFTDRLANAEHARFVFAHETLGHFGLRGLIGDKQFEDTMNAVYSTNDRARSYADVAMSMDNTKSKADAIEEYLSDYAGSIETNLLANIWYKLKNALNKIGLQFGDESVRFLLNQAKRYVRTGQKSAVFDTSDIAARIRAVEAQSENALRKLNAFVDVNLAANDMLRSGITKPGVFETIQELFGGGTGKASLLARGAGRDVSSRIDMLKKNYLSLYNYSALENTGATRFNDLMSEMRDISMRVKVQYNERLRFVLNRAIHGNLGGLSEQDEDNMSILLYHAREAAAFKIREMDTIEAKDAKGNVRPKPLIMLDDRGVWVRNEEEIQRLKNLAAISFEQARDGFDFFVPNPAGGKPKKDRYKGIKGLTKDSVVWRGYEAVRDAMIDIEIELLRAKYSNDINEREVTFQELGALMSSGTMNEQADRDLFLKMVDKVRSVASENMSASLHGAVTYDDDALKAANTLLETLNKALVTTDPDSSFKALRKFFSDTKEADDVEASLRAMRSRASVTRSNKFLLQNKIKQAVFAAEMMSGAEKFTKASIAGHYIPIYRDGMAEVRVEARVGGKRVLLKDTYKDRLSYSQFEAVSDAEIFRDELNKNFAGKTFQAEVLNDETGEFELADVQLVAVSGDALTQLAVHPELNYNEFVRGLKQFDISLAPQKMADVLTALSTQNSSMRNRLQSSFSPGYDQRMAMTAVSRHIDARAASIAKTTTRARLNELMNLKLGKSQRLWRGDQDAVIARREHYDRVMADPRSNEDAKRDARTAFQTALYQYRKTVPAAEKWDGTRATKDSFSIGGPSDRAMRHYNAAAATLAFIDGNRFVDETDFGSGRAASAIRSWTGVLQLGGAIAQGALNLLSTTTNWLPYMASYNQKNGFGGGFSLGRSVQELMRAMKQVGGPGMDAFSATGRAMNTAEFYADLASDPAKAKKYGLEPHEAAFIAQEIREGVFIPAQFNALAGTSRGAMGLAGTNRKGIALVQKFVDAFMAPFNLTEAASRRSAGLAAYRLAYARAIAAHPGAPDLAQAKARDFAVRSVTLTMGEYSVLNRPPAWRDGIQSFLFMYKAYPVTTIQLLSNLSDAGKTGMLTSLWMVSGLSGLPGAEDMEDILDTLAQKLGFKMGSIRAIAARTIDEHFPGLSPIVFKGLLNQILPIPADVASRMSVGDLIPGTGAFLAGANVGQEIKDIVGPAGGFIAGTAQFASDLVKLPFSPTTTVQGTLRDSPVTALRMLGDSWAYMENGAIVDKRGYIVSKDMHAGTILTRLLGFYPQPAADQYEFVRLANRLTGYQREMSTTFRTAWVQASMTGDQQRANEIVGLVNDWNEGTRGTALEIRNFVKNSQRALIEARMEAAARTKKAAPISARPELQQLIEALTD